MKADGLMLTDDLIFFSRVAGVARSRGLRVRQARTQEELLRLAASDPPGAILLDLHNETLDLAALLGGLGESRPRLVGYGSHVDAARLRAARQAGVDLVMPRSLFVEKLPTDLATWLKPEASLTAGESPPAD